MRELINSDISNIQVTHIIESSYTKYIKERLCAWAEWYSQCNFFGIGFSARTIEDRLMVEGAIINSTAPKSFVQNSEAEEIEGYLNEMFRQESEIAIAVRWHYFFYNDSYRTQAKQLTELGFNISYGSLKLCVDKAHHWLQGRMSSRSKYNYLWVGGNTVDPSLNKLWQNMDRYTVN